MGKPTVCDGRASDRATDGNDRRHCRTTVENASVTKATPGDQGATEPQLGHHSPWMSPASLPSQPHLARDPVARWFLKTELPFKPSGRCGPPCTMTRCGFLAGHARSQMPVKPSIGPRGWPITLPRRPRSARQHAVTQPPSPRELGRRVRAHWVADAEIARIDSVARDATGRSSAQPRARQKSDLIQGVWSTLDQLLVRGRSRPGTGPNLNTNCGPLFSVCSPPVDSPPTGQAGFLTGAGAPGLRPMKYEDPWMR
jgi:hypothetical protein